MQNMPSKLLYCGLSEGGYTEMCCTYLNDRNGLRGWQMGQSFVNMPVARRGDDAWGTNHYLYQKQVGAGDACITWAPTRE